MRVALVYDRVNKFGGAERVLTALHEIWPEAPLFTGVYDSEVAGWAKGWDIRTSFLQSFPFAKKWHEGFGWMMPLAFESFDFSEFDVIISVTSEAAKGIITNPRQLHICYLLTPTRYLWSHANEYLSEIPTALKPLARIAQVKLRVWDFMAAQRPDYFLSISKLVQRRCWKYYRREAEVVYPMLGLSSSLNVERRTLNVDQRSTHSAQRSAVKSYFLVVSRLVPYKRIDLAIKAYNRLKLPLVIVGTGSEEKSLKRLAGRTIKFTGYLTDQGLIEYYRNARAIIMPQEEDFGLTAVEALSFGVPVISYKHSGAAEMIKDGETGILFGEQSVNSLAEAIKKIKNVKFRPAERGPASPCTRRYGASQDKLHNEIYSQNRFKQEFKDKINKLWMKHQENIYSR
ncbi:glycosyltransferase [Candidatus Collierbacteria bacterium]|nr:glycosyltransferase [Candidatus Collierbacteria bacterium]